MNNKFKRALSSILAFIMLLSMVTVMNVSNVFAATTNVAELYYPGTGDVTNTDTSIITSHTFTDANNRVEPDATVDITLNDGTTKTLSKYTKLGSGFNVTFTINGTGSVLVYYRSRSDKNNSTGVSLAVGDGLTSSSKPTAYVLNETACVSSETTSNSEFSTVEWTGLPAGTYSIYRSNKEGVCAYVKVTDVISGDLSTYTINGTSNVISSSITVDGVVCDTDESGNFTVTKKVASTDAAPYVAGQEIAVSCTGYYDGTATLVATEDSTVFTTNVELEELVLTALENGKYTSFLMPNFESGPNGDNAFTTTTASTNSKFTGCLTFKLDSAKNVTFNYKCGSTTENKSATFTLSSEDGAQIYTKEVGVVDCVDGKGTSEEETITKTLEAGTYVITGASNSSTTLQLVSVTVEDVEEETQYVVFQVSKEDAAKCSSYNIVKTDGSEEVVDTGNTVYTGIQYDEDTVEDAPDGYYVVAYIVSGASGVDQETINSKFKIELVEE